MVACVVAAMTFIVSPILWIVHRRESRASVQRVVETLGKEQPHQGMGQTGRISTEPRLEAPGIGAPLAVPDNRTKLIQKLVDRRARTTEELTLIIVELPSYRLFQEAYGTTLGDELIHQASLCLQQFLPTGALIARSADNEFAIVLETEADRPTVQTALRQAASRLLSGLKVDKLSVPVKTNIGIAYAPEHANTLSSLLNAAESACHKADKLANNVPVVFNTAQRKQARRRCQLEINLQQALGKEEFSVHYQPQIDLKTERTVGMEALARWQNRQWGNIAPQDFIPLAEKSRLIKQLGAWILERAIADHQHLTPQGIWPAMLSVNLSPKQFDGGQIVADVERILCISGFDPSVLCLEIADTGMSMDRKYLRQQLFGLSAMGVRLSIDDFGVGYSSLLELRDYPISEIKIDNSLIRGIENNTHSQTIVRALVNMAHGMGVDVTAEGVENEQQLSMVSQLGCDRAQGYYLCKPIEASTFPDVLLNA